jgi:hypothetical protein
VRLRSTRATGWQPAPARRAREVRHLDRHDHPARTLDRAGEVGVDGVECHAFRTRPEAWRTEHHVEHDRACAGVGECIDEPRVHAARPRLESRRAERFAIFREDVRGEAGAIGRQRTVLRDRQREAFAGRFVQLDDQHGIGRGLHAAHAIQPAESVARFEFVHHGQRSDPGAARRGEHDHDDEQQRLAEAVGQTRDRREGIGAAACGVRTA